jgi:RNA polymerase sigma-70 factor, ECF subfamily
MSVKTVPPPTRRVQLEDALVCDAARGDQRAFAALYDGTSSRIYGLIKRVLIDVAQSEEVTQEVFLEVWQSANRYDATVGSALSWMMTIAHRRAIDRVRSSQSARERDLRIGIRDRPIEYDAVADTVEMSLDYQRAHRALQRATPLQREALTLAYWDGLTSNEIAAKVGASASTVRTRLRDGLKRMRMEMNAEI